MKVNVDKSLATYLRKVLVLAQIPFDMKDGVLEAQISEEMYTRYVGRARCEKKTDETGFLYVTKEEAEDGGFMIYLLQTRKESAYHILG